jgi:hypothetical protein
MPYGPRLRRIRFPVIAIVVIVLLPSCWLVVTWHAATIEQEAAAAVQDMGGSVDYERPQAPKWLCALFGDRLFTRIWRVRLRKFASDADLVHVGRLTHLNTLDVTGSDITDDGFENLKHLTQLRELYLVETKITDAGLENLEGLTKLQWLDLGGTKVTDAGLRHLRGLAQLRSLALYDTDITDAGLEDLKWLGQLESLNLYGVKITDAGVKHLIAIVGLRELWLGETQVSTAGLKQIHAALPRCAIFPDPSDD